MTNEHITIGVSSTLLKYRFSSMSRFCKKLLTYTEVFSFSKDKVSRSISLASISSFTPVLAFFMSLFLTTPYRYSVATVIRRNTVPPTVYLRSNEAFPCTAASIIPPMTNENRTPNSEDNTRNITYIVYAPLFFVMYLYIDFPPCGLLICLFLYNIVSDKPPFINLFSCLLPKKICNMVCTLTHFYIAACDTFSTLNIIPRYTV